MAEKAYEFVRNPLGRTETETDPVLGALIAKLPPSGAVWSAKKRAAWMQMMWMGFDLVYEVEAGEVLEVPSFLRPAGDQAAAAADVPAPPPARPRPAPYAFLIDTEGYARRGDGTRLMPTDVGGVVYDQRGEGDLGAIIWADESRGVRGLQLDISPAA